MTIEELEKMECIWKDMCPEYSEYIRYLINCIDPERLNPEAPKGEAIV